MEVQRRRGEGGVWLEAAPNPRASPAPDSPEVPSTRQGTKRGWGGATVIKHLLSTYYAGSGSSCGPMSDAPRVSATAAQGRGPAGPLHRGSPSALLLLLGEAPWPQTASSTSSTHVHLSLQQPRTVSQHDYLMVGRGLPGPTARLPPFQGGDIVFLLKLLEGTHNPWLPSSFEASHGQLSLSKQRVTAWVGWDHLPLPGPLINLQGPLCREGATATSPKVGTRTRVRSSGRVPHTRAPRPARSDPFPVCFPPHTSSFLPAVEGCAPVRDAHPTRT